MAYLTYDELVVELRKLRENLAMICETGNDQLSDEEFGKVEKAEEIMGDLDEILTRAEETPESFARSKAMDAARSAVRGRLDTGPEKKAAWDNAYADTYARVIAERRALLVLKGANLDQSLYEKRKSKATRAAVDATNARAKGLSVEDEVTYGSCTTLRTKLAFLADRGL
jgi:hypothetical protein